MEVSDRGLDSRVTPLLPSPLHLFRVASSLGTTSLDDLEAKARSLTRAHLRAWFPRFPDTEEATLLSTCHRVELVLLAHSPEEVD